MAFILPELPYAYDSLKEYIDEETMKIHHDLHHGGYVTKLNAALEGHGDLLEMDIVELLKNIDKVPSDKKQAVINNAGGHANHSLFWEIMSPDGGGEPEGELQNAIEEIFGSFEDFKNEFSEAAVGRFGSGWAWLAF
ncbi:MAG TPA: superoxide dismutase, partial [Candidatus Dojkabacteria bacterium]